MFVVESVADEGAAARAGIRAGDVVRRIGSQDVETIGDAQSAIAAIPQGKAIPALIERDGQTRFVLIRDNDGPSDTRE